VLDDLLQACQMKVPGAPINHNLPRNEGKISDPEIQRLLTRETKKAHLHCMEEIRKHRIRIANPEDGERRPNSCRLPHTLFHPLPLPPSRQGCSVSADCIVRLMHLLQHGAEIIVRLKVRGLQHRRPSEELQRKLVAVFKERLTQLYWAREREIKKVMRRVNC
jgi:hypothetical protein